jgi:CRISPR type IV-associated protein Csf2
MQINATIKLLSPLHITAPSNTRISAADGKISYNSTDIPLNVVQTMHLLRPFACEENASLHDDDDSAILAEFIDDAESDIGSSHAETKTLASRATARLPVIAANNICGRLRRAGATLVLSALRAKGQKVSLQVYSVLQNGAWTGNPDGSDVTLEEYRRARAHVYLGLFGGGPRMIPRGFRAGNALPALEWVREHLNIPFNTPPMPPSVEKNLTHVFFFRRNDDLFQLANLPQIEASLADYQHAVSTYQRAIIDKKSESRTGESKISSQTFAALEFVVPGTVFDGWFTLRDDLSDAQIGLFLLALEGVVQGPIGGYVRNGFGRIALDAVTAIGPQMDDEPALFRSGKLDRSNPFVARVLAAWEEAAEAIDVEELNYLCRITPQKKGKGKSTRELSGAEAELDRLVYSGT